MCFSAEASFVASAALGAIGAAGFAMGPLPAERPLATIPLLFAAQQLAEGFVWSGLAAGDRALVSASGAAYVLFAFFVWPIFVPFAVMRIEPSKRRRRTQEWLLVVGACAAVFITGSLARGPLVVSKTAGHLFYGLDLPLREEAIGFYFLAVCAPLLSSFAWVRVFGLALVLGLAASLAHFAADFVSLWCFAAALASSALALHLRERGGQRRAVGTLPAPTPLG